MKRSVVRAISLGPGNGEDMDDQIKRMLKSRDKIRQTQGLILLINQYQHETYKYLKSRNKMKNRRFSPDELAEVWHQTVVSIWKNTQKGNFSRKGNLYAYIKKIADRRACDAARERAAICVQGIDIDSDIEDGAARREKKNDELMAAIRDAT